MPKPLEIATTIRSQIQSGRDSNGTSGRHMMMCWGYEYPSMVEGYNDYWGGLQFHVSGFKHKGTVKVMLHYNDTYTVFFIDTKGNEVHSIDYIHFPELAETIDNFIETEEVLEDA
jgi:hypothetical protein